MSEFSEEKPLGEPLIGSWTIEKNPPYGVVIRNISPESLDTQYHFWFESNGWITAKNKTSLNVLNTHGKSNGAPHLCDKPTLKKMERIEELRKRGSELSHKEAKELLILIGIIKE
jgi:hypothetical protein